VASVAILKEVLSMKERGIFYYLGLVTRLGLVMIFWILAGLFIGLFLDRRFGGGGLWMILFVLLGIAAGFYSAYRLIMGKGR